MSVTSARGTGRAAEREVRWAGRDGMTIEFESEVTRANGVTTLVVWVDHRRILCHVSDEVLWYFIGKEQRHETARGNPTPE